MVLKTTYYLLIRMFRKYNDEDFHLCLFIPILFHLCLFLVLLKDTWSLQEATCHWISMLPTVAPRLRYAT